jgi:hypothetical protein
MGGKPRRYWEIITTLSQACAAERNLWVFCKACGHARRADPRPIMRAVSRDPALAQLALKMRCDRCSARAAVIIPDDTCDLPLDPRFVR